jgi:hypothetical protein
MIKKGFEGTQKRYMGKAYFGRAIYGKGKELLAVAVTGTVVDSFGQRFALAEAPQCSE